MIDGITNTREPKDIIIAGTPPDKILAAYATFVRTNGEYGKKADVSEVDRCKVYLRHVDPRKDDLSEADLCTDNLSMLINIFEVKGLDTANFTDAVLDEATTYFLSKINKIVKKTRTAKKIHQGSPMSLNFRKRYITEVGIWALRGAEL